MRPESRIRAILLNLLAVAAVVLFAVVGLRHMAEALPRWPYVTVGAPYTTTDSWLASRVTGDSPSETLAQALNAIPGDGALLFVAKEGTDYAQTYYAAQYLAGLRPMTLLVCGADGQPIYHLTDPSAIDAVLTMEPSIPSRLGSGQRLGPLLSVIPTGGKQAWPSYCP